MGYALSIIFLLICFFIIKQSHNLFDIWILFLQMDTHVHINNFYHQIYIRKNPNVQIKYVNINGLFSIWSFLSRSFTQIVKVSKN